MFQGNDLTKYSERQMQQVRGSEIAMIFQDPMTSLNPTMKVGKQIEEMLKEEGDAVKAGDVLARLDTRPLELAIAQKKAVIAQQEAVVEKLHNGSRPEEITQAAAQVESLAAAENNARA